MLTDLSLRVLPLFLSVAAVMMGCSANADDATNIDSESSEYRTFRTLDSDSYHCNLSDGRRHATATLSRSLSVRIARPEELFTLDVGSSAVVDAGAS